MNTKSIRKCLYSALIICSALLFLGTGGYSEFWGAAEKVTGEQLMGIDENREILLSFFGFKKRTTSSTLDLVDDAMDKGFDAVKYPYKMFVSFESEALKHVVFEVPSTLSALTSVKVISVKFIMPASMPDGDVSVFMWKNGKEYLIDKKDIKKKTVVTNLTLTKGDNYLCAVIKMGGTVWGRSRVVYVDAPFGEPDPKDLPKVIPFDEKKEVKIIEDTKDPSSFQEYLDKSGVPFLPTQVSEKVTFIVTGKGNKPLPNAVVKIMNGSSPIIEGKTVADGTYCFFPGEFGKGISEYNSNVSHGKKSKSPSFKRTDKTVEVNFDDEEQPAYTKKPVDIVFVVDTTGSMGSSIGGMRGLEEFIGKLDEDGSSKKFKSVLRAGMVLFKDRGDPYITKVTPLTTNLAQIKKEMEAVRVSGGGDTPEDLNTAMTDMIKKMAWNKDGLRIAFIITDAPPHLDYKQPYTYVTAIKEANKMGLKIYTVGTSGINKQGEVILRQIANYTNAQYVAYSNKARAHEKWGDMIARLISKELKNVAP